MGVCLWWLVRDRKRRDEEKEAGGTEPGRARSVRQDRPPPRPWLPVEKPGSNAKVAFRARRPA